MYCECGCGQITNIASSNRPNRGVKKGEHYRYIAGHHPHGFPKGHKINNGRIETEKHKKKISEAMLNSEKTIGHPVGVPSWNKGLSKAKGEMPNCGGTCSDETKCKISEALIGRSLTNEHKRNVSLGMIGNNPSIQTRKKMSIALKKRWANPEYKKTAVMFKSGNIPWNKGKKNCFTKEAIKKMLERRTPSSLEEKFISIVNKNSLPYKFVGDGSFMIGRKNPDFININGKKIAIEVYARYYKLKHSKTIEEWKINRQEVFKEYGWRIIFFDETEVNENNVLQRLGR